MITRSVRVTFGHDDQSKVWSEIATVDQTCGRLTLYGADGGVVVGFSVGSWSNFEVLRPKPAVDEISPRQESMPDTNTFAYQPGDVVVSDPETAWVVITASHWVYIGTTARRFIRAYGTSTVGPSWTVWRDGEQVY